MDINDVDFEEPLEETGYSEEESDYLYEEPTGASSEDEGYNYTEGYGVSPESGDLTSDEVMLDFLRYNGIYDPERIKFEDEDGIIKERSWADLSYDEKMNILTTSQAQPERDLDDDEIALINDKRSRNLSSSLYINSIRQQAAKDYADSYNAEPQFRVDDLSDDEIFILDLQDKVEDATDDEIEMALEKAKEDPLFSKRVDAMRNELKVRENSYNQQLAFEREQAEEENFNQFRDSVVDSIYNFNKVGDLDINLEGDDMEDIASFILDKDETGMSYMGKALNDPNSIVEMAWWLLRGRDTLNSISDYFSNEIKNIRLESYQRGVADGRRGNSKVIHRPQNYGQPQRTESGEMTIDDLWG